MIRFEWDPEEGFRIVDGYEEFTRAIGKNGSFEVVDAGDGKTYHFHEVGDQIHILSRAMQFSLERLADDLIREAAARRMH